MPRKKWLMISFTIAMIPRILLIRYQNLGTPSRARISVQTGKLSFLTTLLQRGCQIMRSRTSSRPSFIARPLLIWQHTLRLNLRYKNTLTHKGESWHHVVASSGHHHHLHQHILLCHVHLRTYHGSKNGSLTLMHLLHSITVHTNHCQR